MQLEMREHLIRSYPEGKFQILSSPHLHACVICAQIFKVGLAYGKQAPGHGGRSVKSAGHREHVKDIHQHICTNV